MVDDQEPVRALSAPSDAGADARDLEAPPPLDSVEGRVWSSMDLPGMNPDEEFD